MSDERRCVPWALVLAVSGFSMPQASVAGPLEQGASEVVSDYFAAVFAGDTETMKSALCPAMLEKKESVFDSLGYSDAIRARYVGATLAVDQVVALGVDRAQVGVELTLGNGELITTSFTVLQEGEGSYCIEGEAD